MPPEIWLRCCGHAGLRNKRHLGLSQRAERKIVVAHLLVKKICYSPLPWSGGWKACECLRHKGKLCLTPALTGTVACTLSRQR